MREGESGSIDGVRASIRAAVAGDALTTAWMTPAAAIAAAAVVPVPVAVVIPVDVDVDADDAVVAAMAVDGDTIWLHLLASMMDCLLEVFGELSCDTVVEMAPALGSSGG